MSWGYLVLVGPAPGLTVCHGVLVGTGQHAQTTGIPLFGNSHIWDMISKMRITEGEPPVPPQPVRAGRQAT